MSAPQTTLDQVVANGQADHIHVSDALGFATASDTDDLILVDSEFMLVTSGMGGQTWYVTRGYAGTTAAHHDSGATVTRIVRGYTDLSRIKTQIEITDTDDDAILLAFIDSANAEITNRIGFFAGPSTDSVRVYDGWRCDSGTKLVIPGGIRSLSAVRIKESTDGSWLTTTLSDFYLRPLTWDRRAGSPAKWIEISDTAANSNSYFYAGYETIEVTGTFGWAEVPDDLAKLADMLVVRMWDFRDAGPETGRMPTPSRFVFPDDAALLEEYRREYMDGIY